MIEEYQKYNMKRSPYAGLLTLIGFNSVHEYLKDLEHISQTLAKNKVASITYLAAAVSDFYIPQNSMNDLIQSNA